MMRQTNLPGVAISPKSKVVMRMEISTEINISASAARQRANRFLIMQVGDQLGAMEPELVVADPIQWRLPVQYAPSLLGSLGIVGHLLVDAQTGETTIADGRTVADLQANAELLQRGSRERFDRVLQKVAEARREPYELDRLPEEVGPEAE